MEVYTIINTSTFMCIRFFQAELMVEFLER